MSADATRSDAGWSDEAAEAPRAKRRVPTWVWWTCGSGCLVTAIALIAVAVVVGRFASDVLDPDKAWGEVREVLPFDERPAGWEARGGSLFGRGHYFLVPEPGTVLLVQRFANSAELELMFDPESVQNRGFGPFEPVTSPEAGTLELQGREVRTLRFQGGVPEELVGGDPAIGLRLDVSTPQRHALVQVSTSKEKPLSSERVAELLAPFDVWRAP